MGAPGAGSPPWLLKPSFQSSGSGGLQASALPACCPRLVSFCLSGCHVNCDWNLDRRCCKPSWPGHPEPSPAGFHSLQDAPWPWRHLSPLLPWGCPRDVLSQHPLWMVQGGWLASPQLSLPCEAACPQPWPGAQAGPGGQSGPVPTGPPPPVADTGALSEPFPRQSMLLAAPLFGATTDLTGRSKVGK